MFSYTGYECSQASAMQFVDTVKQIVLIFLFTAFVDIIAESFEFIVFTVHFCNMVFIKDCNCC